MGFQQGVSGLNVAAKALDVTSNNIANSQTVGFKAARTLFADIYANQIQGFGGNQVGNGAMVDGIWQSFTQGNIQQTSNPLDIAINGNGFMRMMATNGTLTYTRNGQFQLDKDGYVVNAEGLKLTGWNANAIQLMSRADPTKFIPAQNQVTALQITATNMNPYATQDIPSSGSSTPVKGLQLAANLDSRLTPPTKKFDLNDPTTYNNSTSATVYDSLGNPHTLSMFFVKQDANAAGTINAFTPAGQGVTSQWSVFTYIDLDKVANAVSASLAGLQLAQQIPGPDTTVNFPNAGAASAQTANGWTISFDANGKPVQNGNANLFSLAQTIDPSKLISGLNSANTATIATGGTIGNASGANITVANGRVTGTAAGGASNTFTLDMTNVSQYGNNFGVTEIKQPGYTSGQLVGLGVDKSGLIQGKYSNGQTQNLAQLGMATFANPQALSSLGGNQWSETYASGQPLYGTPNSGLNGAITPASVENSNVDLNQELVNLIIQQRAYQANTKTISTQDQLIQSLLNIQ